MNYVTEAFRDKVLQSYPNLSKSSGYWYFLLYLLSGGFEDIGTGDIVISANQLARLDGKTKQQEQGNFRAARFLDDFRRDVLPALKWSDGWSFAEGRARTAKPDAIDPDVLEAYQAMQAEIARGARPVDAVTGNVRTRQHEADEEKARLDAIQSLGRSLPFISEPTKAVVAYQNGLPKHGFTSAVKAGIDAALKEAEAIPNAASRRQAMSNIASILLSPKPLVRPVENSPRAFSDRQSLLTVKSDVRRVFTSEWVDYDLKAAQLAIVSREWELPELRAELESDGSVWDALARRLGVSQAMKRELKQAVYSLVFGGSKREITAALESATGQPGLGDLFFADRLVSLVYEARESRVKQHLKARRDVTVLGREVKFPYSANYDERAAPIRSFMAQQAQSLELLLILPVFELARETEQFTVMLYQFDGFTVRFRDRRNWATWHRRITDAVATKAERLGIPTRLESLPGDAFWGDL